MYMKAQQQKTPLRANMKYLNVDYFAFYIDSGMVNDGNDI